MKKLFFASWLLLACAAQYVHAGQISSNIPGLLSVWHFNEGGGSIASAVMSTQAATLINSASFTRGLYGSGLYSTGTAYADITPDSSLEPALLTLVAWFKGGADMMNSLIVKKRAGPSGNAYALEFGTLTGDNRSVAFDWFDGTAFRSVNSSVPVNNANWHMAAGTYDGTTARVFIDGKLISSIPSAAISYNAATTHLIIGAGSNAGTAACNCTMDEVAVFNRALSPGEIGALYGAGLNRHSGDNY